MTLPPLELFSGAGIPAFLAGLIIGIYAERHRDRAMNHPIRERVKARAGKTRESARELYDRWAAFLFILIFSVAMVGVIAGLSAVNTTGGIVSCLERHAEAKVSSDKAVREASELLTTRQKRAARALQDVLEANPGSAEQRRLFDQFKGANARQVDAYRNLEAVREANPVIPDPATYCGL